MSKDKISINLEIEDGKVIGMDIISELCGRTEYSSGEEMSVEDVLFEIRDYIKETQ